MRVQLKDLTPGTNYAIQFRSTNGEDYSEWSQVQRFTTITDTQAPAPVTNLKWTTSGSSFIATWDKAVLDGDGSPLYDLKDYEVRVTNGLISKTYYTTANSFEFTLAMNTDTFGDIGFVLDVYVKSRDLADNVSPAVTKQVQMDVPPVPSTPVVSVNLGLLIVTWDGQPAIGIRSDLNLNHVEIHASTSNNFTPNSTTLKGRFEGTFPGIQSADLSGFPYGTTVYVKLIAVSRVGLKSPPSAQGSGVPTRITGLDIANNQISVAQINFTAKDIGGANAYYPATTTARDALTGVKSGDIAYVTGSGYAAYRYNGTTWVSAPEVGVISGTKILAGTLTSDAVGTNLLITASANIADAAIDSAKISSLNAAKITAGILQSSSTVTYGGGTVRPAWSLDLNGNALFNDVNLRGQLVVGNSLDTTAVRAASVVRSFDYIAGTAGWSIKGDGTVEFNNGTFRGTIAGAVINGSTIVGGALKTANNGRRIEISPSATDPTHISNISFYSPTGEYGFIKQSDLNPVIPGGGEYLQLGISPTENVTGMTPVMTFLTAQSINYLLGTAEMVQFTFAPSQSFSIWESASQTSSAATNRRVLIDGNSEWHWNQSHSSYVSSIWSVLFSPGPNESDAASARGRMYITSTSNLHYYPVDGTYRVMGINSSGTLTDTITLDVTGTFNYFNYNQSWSIWERGISNSYLYYRMSIDHSGFIFRNSASQRRFTFFDSPGYGDSTSSSSLLFTTGSNFGAMITSVSLADGTNYRFEFRDGNNTLWYPLWAQGFVVSSSQANKTGITTLEAGALEKVKSTRVTRFRRKNQKTQEDGPTGKPLPDLNSREEIGIIAEEAPAEIQVRSDKGDLMVDLNGWVAMIAAAVQELSAQVEGMRTDIDNLKKKGQ